MTYWHIGNRRNASATVAITGERRKGRKKNIIYMTSNAFTGE
jgi:hypothetical protein